MAAILNQLQAIFGCLGGPLVLPPEMAEEEEARRERLNAARAARAKKEAESIAAVLPPPERSEAASPPPTAAPVVEATLPTPFPEAVEEEEEEFEEEQEADLGQNSVADEWGWDEEEDEEDTLGQAPPFTQASEVAESDSGLEPLTRLPTLDEIKARAAMGGTVHIKTAGNPFLDPLGLGAVVGAADASPQTMAAQLGQADDEEEEEEEDFFADMAPTLVPAKTLVIDAEEQRDVARSRLALQYTEDDDEDDDAWGDDLDDDAAGGEAKGKEPQVSKLSGVSFTFEDSDEDLADLDDLDFDGL